MNSKMVKSKIVVLIGREKIDVVVWCGCCNLVLER
jgi:hypothetical protein